MIIWKYVTDPSKEGNENAYKVSTNLLQGQAAMQMLHTVTFTQNLSAESYSESTE